MDMYLGHICKHGHDNGGGSLRFSHNGVCRDCKRADAARRHKERMADPAYTSRKKANADSWRASNMERARDHARKSRGRPGYRSKARVWEKSYEQRSAKRRLTVRLRKRLRNALANARVGKSTASKTMGIDYVAIINHLGPCPGNEREWHVDHVIPLARFDLSDPAQVQLAFAPENHQWLPALENIRKGSR